MWLGHNLAVAGALELAAHAGRRAEFATIGSQTRADREERWRNSLTWSLATAYANSRGVEGQAAVVEGHRAARRVLGLPVRDHQPLFEPRY